MDSNGDPKIYNVWVHLTQNRPETFELIELVDLIAET